VIEDRLRDAGSELPILVGGSASEPERLILVSRPGSDGVARLREWTSADWAASPTERESPAQSLYEELELAYRQRRALNQDLAVIRAWLFEGRGPGAADR
jgi:hypothetical protein